MPLLYSYINAKTDPDKLWKIQRRTSKLSREVNDDDRGLAETADMSDDVDKLLTDLNIFKNDFIEFTTNIQSASVALERQETSLGFQTDVSLFQNVRIKGMLNSGNNALNSIYKLDFNKMNINNIQQLRSMSEELEYAENILNSVRTTNESIFRRQVGTFKNALKQVITLLQQIRDSLDVKLANYRQTTAVLREEGLQGAGYGGCCCNNLPLEYMPQYQTKMYY
jgi:hypothetical protein